MVTQHTTSFCSVQVVDITHTKTPFHAHYIQQSGTTETSQVQGMTIVLITQIFTKDPRNFRDTNVRHVSSCFKTKSRKNDSSTTPRRDLSRMLLS